MVAFVGALWAITQLPRRRHPLVWLPLLFALWANLHGSFLVGAGGPGGLCGGKHLGCVAGADAACGRPGASPPLPGMARVVAEHGGICLNPLGVGLVSGGCPIRPDGKPGRPFPSGGRRKLGSLTGVLLFVSLAMTAVLVCRSPRRMTVGRRCSCWASDIWRRRAFGCWCGGASYGLGSRRPTPRRFGRRSGRRSRSMLRRGRKQPPLPPRDAGGP